MSNVALPTVYADSAGEVRDADLVGPLVLFNRVPEPLEIDYPVAGPIELMAVNLLGASITAGQITVVSQAGTVVAWTSGGGFHADYAGSVYNTSTSAGGGGPDTHRWQLVRNTPWVSQERVTVIVSLTPTVGAILNETYTFGVEDITPPRLQSARTQGLNTLLVTFDEPVRMDMTATGALRVRDVTGRIAFTATTTVELANAYVPPTSVGDFLCFTGSEQAVNNGYFTIATIVSEDPAVVTVVEQTLRTEAPLLSTRGFLSPFKIQATMEYERVIPTYTPCIIAAEQYDDRTIKLTLDQPMSPGRPYQIIAKNIADAADPENVATYTSVDMVAENLPVVAGRDFSLWDMIPAMNKRDDTSRDLERFVRCLDEVQQLLLYDNDRYGSLYDPAETPEQFIPLLLAHLGNPYTILETTLQQQRAITGLVRTYKDSGVDRAIEQAVFEILGLRVLVFPLNNAQGTWVLGDSDLGDNTILGTSDDFLIYSFALIVYEALDEVDTGATTTSIPLVNGGLVPNAHVGRMLRINNEDSEIVSNTADTIVVDTPFSSAPVTGSTATVLGVLTQDQRDKITQIANTWRTAHTHFVRFIESGTVIPTF